MTENDKIKAIIEELVRRRMLVLEKANDGENETVLGGAAIAYKYAIIVCKKYLEE